MARFDLDKNTSAIQEVNQLNNPNIRKLNFSFEKGFGATKSRLQL